MAFQVEQVSHLLEREFSYSPALLALHINWIFNISIGEFVIWLDRLPVWLNGFLGISAFIVAWFISNPKTSVLRIHNVGGWANLIYSAIMLYLALDELNYDYLGWYTGQRFAMNILIIFGAGVLLNLWLRWKQLAQSQVMFLPILPVAH